MKVSGHATVRATREAVFAAICDPAALLEIIPGCEDVQLVSDGEYRGRLAIRIPALTGTYDTTVRLVRANPPASGELEGRVEGRAGAIVGHATFLLTEADGLTVIDYEGTGTISGPLAHLDGRFIEGLARSLIDEGLARLGALLHGSGVTAPS